MIYFPPWFIQKKHINVPITAIIHQINKLICQPIFSDNTAIPKVDIPLPTYAQAFKIPVIVETFPYFLKNGGTIAVSIEETPCIAPVSNAEQIIDIIALFPEPQ